MPHAAVVGEAQEAGLHISELDDEGEDWAVAEDHRNRRRQSMQTHLNREMAAVGSRVRMSKIKSWLRLTSADVAWTAALLFLFITGRLEISTRADKNPSSLICQKAVWEEYYNI